LGHSTIAKKGSKIVNAQDKEEEEYRGGGESALMLATKFKPVSKAIDIIDALMYSGASMYKRENTYFGHIFFFACRSGVDHTIFDRLIMWDSMRQMNARVVVSM
jgi:hypothetical protein